MGFVSYFRTVASLLSLITLFTATTLPVHARPPKKWLFAIGGGGEPAGNTTIFDNEYVELLTKAKDADYQITAFYNGGHKTSEEKVKAILGKPASEFSINTYSKMIRDIQNKITLGEIQPGDQVLFTVNSHGAPTEVGLKTHKVSCGNDGSVCSLDALIPLFQTMQNKKIKSALIDTSCYSGNSIKIAESSRTDDSFKPCVMSISRKESVGSTYETYFQVRELKKGKNLETAFLDARKARAQLGEGLGYGSPQISTRAGLQLENLSTAQMKQVSTFPIIDAFCTNCRQSGTSAQVDINEIQKLLNLSIALNLDKDYQKYFGLLKEYGLLLNDLKKHTAIMNQQESDPNSYTLEKCTLDPIAFKKLKEEGEIISSGAIMDQNGTLSVQRSWQQIFNSDSLRYIDNPAHSLVQAASGNFQVLVQLKIKGTNQYRTKFLDFKNSCLNEAQKKPEYMQFFRKYVTAKREIIRISGGDDWDATKDSPIVQTATRVFDAENNLYLKYYKGLSNPNDPNSCRDFVF